MSQVRREGCKKVAEKRLFRTDIALQHKCAPVPLPGVRKSFLWFKAEQGRIAATHREFPCGDDTIGAGLWARKK